MHSRLLIVDDDVGMRGMLGALFEIDGHACELAASAEAALQAVDRQLPDVILCDVRMDDGMNGLELLDRVKRMHPTLPVILMTGLGGVDDAVHAIKHGAFQYVTKPCDADKLRNAVTAALAERDLTARRPSRPPPASAGTNVELVGTGVAMRELEKTIGLVAASSAPVLVTGETGVGKELVARAIHARGPRSEKPFVAVNASAIPRDLLEAEVFGHVRGAFTGSSQTRRGLLLEADGGTLLLDEIGDMPMDLQSKLLRVLQSGEVRPVGSDRTFTVDVRIVAATHCDLPALIRAGKFREDLYFRLNVLPVHVPPLRQHPEDIPALVAHFLAAARQRASQSPLVALPEDVLRALTEASWPGNVRELASVIERAVVFGTHIGLEPKRLPPPEPPATAACSWPFPSDAPWSLRRLSRAYTDWAILHTGGNKEQAAALLGINLSTLYRWGRSRSERGGGDPADPAP
jgi:DNA-binding NtrC family response regulator